MIVISYCDFDFLESNGVEENQVGRF